MISSDWVLVLALLACVGAWWWKRGQGPAGVLIAGSVIGLAAGAYGVAVDRWQAGVGLVVSVLFLVAALIRNRRRSGRPDRAPYVSGSLLTLASVVAVMAIWMYPVWDLPEPTGEQLVGTRTFELVDERRRGVLAAGPDQPRRLLVRVWYPARAAEGLQRRHYFNDVESEYTARSMGHLFRFSPFLVYARHVRTHSYEGAPLLDGATALPTVIYSHGYTSFLSQNTVLMEELASHGYVVYSIQHTYDSSATVFPDGEVAPMDPALIDLMMNSPEAQGKFPAAMHKGYTGSAFDDRLAGQLQQAKDALDRPPRVVRSAKVWLEDRLFVHDQLQHASVPAEIAPIVAASNLERVGEVGMSFGGSTVGAVCVVDPRCAAGVNLDGSDFHFIPFDIDIPRPFLMFHSDMRNLYRNFGVAPPEELHSFNDFSYESFQHAGRRADVYRLQLKDAAHLAFSDFTLFMRRPIRNPLLGATPADVMIGTQNDFVRGFLDKYLRGVANHFPEAEVEKYRDWVVPYDNRPVSDWWQSLSEQQREDWSHAIDETKQRAAALLLQTSQATGE